MQKKVLLRNVVLCIPICIAIFLLIYSWAKINGFSADEVTTLSGGPYKGNVSFKSRIFFKKGRLRREIINFGHVTQIEIDREDKNLKWDIEPGTKLYYEYKKSSSKSMAQKKIGTAVYKGYTCDKLRSSFMTPYGKATMTGWYSKDIELMLKIVTITSKDTTTVEVKNIKRRYLPDSLFELPKGYKKKEFKF